MDIEQYEILGIQKYNTCVANLVEVNFVLKNTRTGRRESIHDYGDLEMLSRYAVVGDTLFVSKTDYPKQKTSYMLSCEEGLYVVDKDKVKCCGSGETMRMMNNVERR
jgi:hypothetical protein